MPQYELMTSEFCVVQADSEEDAMDKYDDIMEIIKTTGNLAGNNKPSWLISNNGQFEIHRVTE